MQAQVRALEQEQDTALITATRSGVAVKTLISAGFGCLTYLRGLLPDENFEDARLSSLSLSPDRSVDSDIAVKREGKSASGVRVKTVKRGYSTEGDQLLDYIEHGIFDALEKQYLKSFVFVIYLDKEDPTNIIESWTFSFRYPRDPVTGEASAAISIDNHLANMSLNEHVSVDTSALRGDVTIGDVKRSLKSLTKAIISASQGMDSLPGRRYATFKLFYYDEAPDNYEPPFFVPADATKDKFFFATHAHTEVPDKVVIGSLDTSFHSVSIGIASIASIIPSGEDNGALYYGLQNAKAAVDNTPSKTFYEASQSLQRETAIQLADAQDRNVVWDADNDAANALHGEDAEGEPDPLYPHLQDGASLKEPQPLGIRQADGSLRPYSSPAVKHTSNIIKSKRQDERSVDFNSQTSSKLATRLPSEGMLTQTLNTQASIPQTPTNTTSANKENLNTPTKKASTSWTTPVAANSISVDFLRPNQSIVSHGIDTQDLKVVLSGEQTAEAGAVHKSALGVRSNLPADWRQEPMIPDPVGEAHDSISSFSSSSRIHYPATGLDEDIVMPSQSSAEIGAQSSQAAIEGNNEDAVVNITAAVRPTIESEQTFRADSSQETQVQFTEAETQTQMKTVAQMGERDTTAPCDCGSKSQEINWIYCEACRRWLHTWCMGYHNSSDHRIPKGHFTCFTCQLRADPHSTLLTEQMMEGISSRWSDLTLFRHALKIVSNKGKDCPDTQNALRKRLDIEARTAGQVWKRLEQEGFIAPPVESANRFGATAKNKPRGRKPAKRFFVESTEIRGLFGMYFEPGGALEKGLIGIQVKPSMLADQAPDAAAAANSVTEDATKEPTEANQESSAVMVGTKRKADGPAEMNDQHHTNRAKRHKISLAAQPVDLAED